MEERVAMSVANVFVLGADDDNLAQLQRLPEADDLRFHPLLPGDQLLDLQRLDLPARLDEMMRTLREFDGTVDALVGYWDFPVSSVLPILCREFDLPGPNLEGVLRCEHKYWSRLEQDAAIEEVPAFALVQLDEDPELPDNVPLPFWLKPIKSASSQLAFMVTTEDEFRDAVRRIDEEIDAFSAPFDAVLDMAELPQEITDIGGRAGIAEEAATGRQFTVEGYCIDDRPHVYGVVETVLYPGSSNFLRYEYPASLPPEVEERMVETSKRVMRSIRLGSSCFNIEYFWDEDRDRILLLEINPRLSQSHTEIIELVDGTSHFHAMVQIALGGDPEMPHRKGTHAVAGQFFPRLFHDGVTVRAPSSEDIERAIRDLPGVTSIHSAIEEGEAMSDLPHQDPYSYALGQIVVGGADTRQLAARYEACLDALGIEIEGRGVASA